MSVVPLEGMCGIPAIACPYPLYWLAVHGWRVEETIYFSTVLNPCQKWITWPMCHCTAETAGLHARLSYMP